MKTITNKIRELFQIQRGLLVQYGWLRSWWHGRPLDASGEPIPWITYPAIEFLSQISLLECIGIRVGKRLFDALVGQAVQAHRYR